ncbi:hypothetical protein ARMSODRAFT_214573 [Armillaria solidipes]|uniref:Uncharacterized protein n=1 Tax=Armillaria solidipes TaxID=1076256 RepID=A0A2H3BBU8_9AGAR|nr:hypothetical protein ARMSODRAFT_214573 [Armillaria solidipes]
MVAKLELFTEPSLSSFHASSVLCIQVNLSSASCICHNPRVMHDQPPTNHTSRWSSYRHLPPIYTHGLPVSETDWFSCDKNLKADENKRYGRINRGSTRLKVYRLSLCSRRTMTAKITLMLITRSRE